MISCRTLAAHDAYAFSVHALARRVKHIACADLWHPLRSAWLLQPHSKASGAEPEARGWHPSHRRDNPGVTSEPISPYMELAAAFTDT